MKCCIKCDVQLEDDKPTLPCEHCKCHETAVTIEDNIDPPFRATEIIEGIIPECHLCGYLYTQWIKKINDNHYRQIGWRCNNCFITKRK